MSVGTTEVTALVGAVIGTAGFVLGIVNYLRDRPEVRVTLDWDMAVTDNPRYDPNKRWCVVTAANVGRRPIYISRASLKLPKGYDRRYLLIYAGLVGQRLAEGDPPASYVVGQDGLEQYGKDWPKIRAVVFDTAAKEYRSPRPDRSKPPSWGKK